MSAEAYFYFARIKSRTFIRDSGTDFAKLTRDSIKNTNLALGQNSSFCRQCKIFRMLLAGWYFPFPLFFVKIKLCTNLSYVVQVSLKEYSLVIRAKAWDASSRVLYHFLWNHCCLELVYVVFPHINFESNFDSSFTLEWIL